MIMIMLEGDIYDLEVSLERTYTNNCDSESYKTKIRGENRKKRHATPLFTTGHYKYK